MGLDDVEVLGINDEGGAPLRVHIRRRTPRPGCEVCGGLVWSDGERQVELVDLPAFGRPARLVQQAAVALREPSLCGGDCHRTGPRDRAAAREADLSGGTLGDAPGGQGTPRQRGCRGAVL